MLILLLREIVVAKIEGSFAELGVHRWLVRPPDSSLLPGTPLLPARYLHGLRAEDLKKESVGVAFTNVRHLTDTGIELVRKNISTD